MKRERLETIDKTGLYEIEKKLDHIEKIVGILVDSLDELRQAVRQEKAARKLEREKPEL